MYVSGVSREEPSSLMSMSVELNSGCSFANTGFHCINVDSEPPTIAGRKGRRKSAVVEVVVVEVVPLLIRPRYPLLFGCVYMNLIVARRRPSGFLLYG